MISKNNKQPAPNSIRTKDMKTPMNEYINEVDVLNEKPTLNIFICNKINTNFVAYLNKPL